MFGNTNALDTVFEIERLLREQTEKKFSEIPSKNLVKIVQNFETIPIYRHPIMIIERITSKIQYGKEYGTQKQLLNNPEAYIPTERDKDVILNILYNRL